jgi:hypothetical protein
MKKVLSILGGIICGIICIFLFGIQIGFITFTSVKTLITKDSISKIVNEIDVKEIISTSPTTTSDIYGVFDTLGFSVEETDKILESNSFKEFLDEYLYNNIDNIINDKDVSLSYDAIVKLVDDVESETNLTLKNKQTFLKLVQVKYPEIEKSLNISNYVKNNINESDLQVIRLILGNTITIVFIVLFIVTYLIMCLFRWSIYKPLIWYGITTVLSSFIMLQAFLGIAAVKSLITGDAKNFEFIISPILKVIKNKGLIVSLIMLALGIIMIVGFALIHKKMKEEEKNENFEMLDDNQTVQTL